MGGGWVGGWMDRWEGRVVGEWVGEWIDGMDGWMHVVECMRGLLACGAEQD